MFPVGKIAWPGVAFALLTIGMFVQGFPRRPAGSDSAKEGGAAFVIKDEIKKMQETLRNKGHYLGKVDGVFGLRTRDSIRAYQKAENLPITGQVDTRTADGLGVRPGWTWGISNHAERDFERDSGRAAGEMNRDKPSAGIRRPGDRASKTSRKEASRATAIQDRRGDGANQQQAQNEKHNQ